MTDRELQEAAAAVAKIPAVWDEEGGWMVRPDPTRNGLTRRLSDWILWQPLTDYADAFELLTTPHLGLGLQGQVRKFVYFLFDGLPYSIEVDHPHSRESVCRAIVRAAAKKAELLKAVPDVS